MQCTPVSHSSLNKMSPTGLYVWIHGYQLVLLFEKMIKVYEREPPGVSGPSQGRPQGFLSWPHFLFMLSILNSDTLGSSSLLFQMPCLCWYDGLHLLKLQDKTNFSSLKLLFGRYFVTAIRNVTNIHPFKICILSIKLTFSHNIVSSSLKVKILHVCFSFLVHNHCIWNLKWGTHSCLLFMTTPD